ncbi:MAG: metal-dependent transcriptional regulator [Polyangia bacterium]|jgi:DtxR family Mn-dependent transcriptional regulator|nr:metal-dependent transcriptional regulator [Polyangia bacterium]
MIRIHHDVAEELLETIWVLGEQGPVSREKALAACHVRAPRGALLALEAEGLVELDLDWVSLTAAGEGRAAFIIRRQRLGEVLALRAMGFRHMEEKQAVCEFEHVITEGDIDRLCAQLGHPSRCPDGEPIPSGPCCALGESPSGLAVSALSDLQAGQRGRILYVRRQVRARVRALMSYGILGGARFELKLRYPAFVIFVEGVEVALDSEVASDVFALLDPTSG